MLFLIPEFSFKTVILRILSVLRKNEKSEGLNQSVDTVSA